jgi:hypothetical protein
LTGEQEEKAEMTGKNGGNRLKLTGELETKTGTVRTHRTGKIFN